MTLGLHLHFGMQDFKVEKHSEKCNMCEKGLGCLQHNNLNLRRTMKTAIIREDDSQPLRTMFSMWDHNPDVSLRIK